MRALCVVILCAVLAACHKKTPPPPPPPIPAPAQPAAPAAAPKKAAKSRKAQRAIVPAAAASQAEAPPLGEFVEPSQRAQILAEIDRNIRQAAERLLSIRPKLPQETALQIDGLLAQAQAARSKNMLITARQLSSRALALTQ